MKLKNCNTLTKIIIGVGCLSSTLGLMITPVRSQQYGPATCRQGYVWREAVANDLVCVTPKIRTQTAYENSQAVYRRVGSVQIDNGTNLIPASN